MNCGITKISPIWRCLTALFDRVVSILEQARGNVVRSVNSNMVTAYWLIGREIVQELQGGEERAEYGKKVVEDLSKRLNEKYGKGFSIANIKNFRQFYHVYSHRLNPIGSPKGSQLLDSEKSYPVGSQSAESEKHHQLSDELAQGFSSQLTWSHYRALMRLEDKRARDFYECEAIECGWNKAQLERQIHSFYYNRILSNQGKEGLIPEGRKRLPGETVDPTFIMKSPVVLEFLGLPDPPELCCSKRF